MSRYMTDWKIGRGFFGQVFAGRKREDDTPVALKKIHQSAIKRYIHQIPLEIYLMTMGSNVPGVIQFLEWYREEDFYVIVMERSDNSTNLKEFMAEEDGSLNEYVARNIVSQVSFALHSLITIGIFHGDIKCENILIEKRSHHIKLIDFGCSSFFHDGLYHEFHGSRALQPPEMLKHKRYKAEPATVWSIGVLLYRMLTGFWPFNTDIDIVYCRYQMPTNISHRCVDFLHRSLAEEPSNRITLLYLLNHSFLFPHCML